MSKTKHSNRGDLIDMEIAVQYQLSQHAAERLRTLAQREAFGFLTSPSMRSATVLERCRRVAAILDALAKNENGISADAVSCKDGMRITDAIESAAYSALAEYADWHTFLESHAGRYASAWEIDNLARLRDQLGGPQDQVFYERMLAAFRACKRTERADARS